MTCQEAMLAIIKRQTEGLMYHDEMTDYYTFLNLGLLKKIHRRQTEEELRALQKVKCDFITAFGVFPDYDITDPKAIPASWMQKTSDEADEPSLKILIQANLMKYLQWEEETCKIYKASAKTLKENMNFHLHREVCEMIEDVQKEIHEIKELQSEAMLYDYCPSYFK